MNIDRIYSICLCAIVAVLFFGAYSLSGILYAKGEITKTEEGKNITFTVAPAKESEMSELTLEVTEPRQTEQCDYTDSAYYYDIALENERQDYVFETCSLYDVPCELVFAVMGVESSYIDSHISDNGDYGIMQINSINHSWLSEELGVNDFLNFEQNVLCGVYMLADYYHRYVDFNKIAMCYRYGENAAKEMWNNGITETEYTRKIIRLMATMEYKK